jgi:hypothetical protein
MAVALESINNNKVELSMKDREASVRYRRFEDAPDTPWTDAQVRTPLIYLASPTLAVPPSRCLLSAAFGVQFLDILMFKGAGESAVESAALGSSAAAMTFV